jgi:hypothetical protein
MRFTSAALQIQYGYSHSNESLLTITFVYNYQLLLINFIGLFTYHIPHNISVVTNISIRNKRFYKIFSELLDNRNRKYQLEIVLTNLLCVTSNKYSVNLFQQGKT